MFSDNKNDLNAIANPHYLPKDALHDGISVIHRPHLSRVSAHSEQASGFQFILNGLRRRWKWALPLGLLLSIVAAGVVYMLFKPSYEAVACLRIDARPQYIAFESPAGERDTSKSFVQTQIVLLHHPLVIGPLLANPEIARMPEIAAQPDPIKWLAKQIVVRAESESELYNVSYTASNPDAAAKVVNALVDEYFRLRGQEDAGRTEQVIKILEEELGTRARDVGLLRDTVRDLAKQTTGKDPFAGAAEPAVVVNHPLADLQNHLVNAEVEQEVIKARLKAYKENPVETAAISDAVIENKINMHPEVVRVKEEIAGLQIQLHTNDSYAKKGKNDPTSMQISQQIQSNEKFLEQLRKDLRKTMLVELQSAAESKRDDRIATLQSELESQKITADMLRDRFELQMKDVKQNSGDTLQLRFKQGELERAEKIYGLIAERIVRLRTEKYAPERVVFMQRAVAPTAPIEIFPFRNVMLAALASFAMPFGLALGWEKLICRVGDAASLENMSHLPVVGEVARIPSRGRGGNRRASEQMGMGLRMFEESINSLRTTLMLTEELRDLRILAITSAVTHEGKTSVATQLALSLARTTNKPTLLIDGDMRSPNLHDIFEVPLAPGLTNVLEGNSSIADAIIATSCPFLDLLPAGQLVSNPHQLLGNGAPAALVQSIPEKYRYVILDTPPVLAASESLMLATMADATLVCVLRDVSRIDQIQRAYHRLLIAGGKPVGLVLNGVPTKTYAFNYGSYAFINR